MLGLMEKDLRLTLTRKQTLIVFFVVAMIMGISMERSFIVGYLTMLGTIVAVGTISYDEYDNGFAFLMTLPFDRKTYVREKYLFSLITTVAAWCLGAVLYCIGSIVRHESAALTDELPMLLALIPALYLSASIMIPLQLKYGSERSRIVLFIIFGIITVLAVGSKQIFEGLNIIRGLVTALDGMSPAAALVAIATTCMLAAYASYLCSARIVEKKEF